MHTRLNSASVLMWNRSRLKSRAVGGGRVEGRVPAIPDGDLDTTTGAQRQRKSLHRLLPRTTECAKAANQPETFHLCNDFFKRKCRLAITRAGKRSCPLLRLFLCADGYRGEARPRGWTAGRRVGD
eukprot:GHVT01026222.1.p1 GENE.GHVT01026222.1~~GHVT01026222.1.p1  ORF type:complete len:126 (-),score=12.33 GHVT01026222.1:1081-1458(-)